MTSTALALHTHSRRAQAKPLPKREHSRSHVAPERPGSGGRKVGEEERKQERIREHVHAVRRDVFRHRIDYHWLPDKRIEAVLTITLPDGNAMVFTAQADPHQIAAALAAQNPEIGGFSLGKLWKGVKKVAKGVATSKVFKLAGTALAAAAPAFGPLAPAMLGASAAMKASTALLAAKHHAAKGNKAGAQQLIEYAQKAVKVVDKTTKISAQTQLPASAALLDAANASAGKVYSLLLKPA
jgi:hypothetical protein